MDSGPKSLLEWDKFIQRRVEELQGYMYARNMVVPINTRLPPELLCEIFVQARELSYANEKYKAYSWFAVGHVCHYWRKLILAYPRFWQRVCLHEDTTTECVKEILARSFPCPLLVTAKYDWIPEDTVPGPLEMVLEQLPRIGTLCIDAHRNVVKAVAKTCKDNAPQLTYLSLISSSGSDPSDIPVPAFSSIPKLKYLDLVYKPMSFPRAQHLLTPGLKQLTIRLGEVPLYRDLQLALGSLPHLELLHVAISLDQNPASVFVERPIFMARMQSVKYECSTRMCAFFLNAISLPVNTAINIDCAPRQRRYTDTDYAVLGNALGNKLYEERKDYKWQLLTFGIHAEDRKVTLSWWRESDPIVIWDRKFRYRMVIVTLSKEHYSLQRVCAAFGAYRIHTLALGDLTSIPSEEQTSALRQMKNVQNLTIMDTSYRSQKALSQLLEEQVCQLPPTLLFPKLSTLYLSSITFVQREPHNTGFEEDRPLARDDDMSSKASMCWSCLKDALATRAQKQLPVTSIVFTKPAGLSMDLIQELKGSVSTVQWDDQTISMDMPEITQATLTNARDPEAEAEDEVVEDSDKDRPSAHHDRDDNSDASTTDEDSSGMESD